MSTLKETIQDNAAVFFLSAVAGGFVAGVTAYNRGLDIFGQTTVSKDYAQSIRQRDDEIEKQLRESVQQNLVLQNKLRNAQTAREAGHPNPVLTTYVRSVQAFVSTPPQQPYQWDGYQADVDKLYAFIQQFLDLQRNPISYADSQPCYGAIDEAASEVSRRALKMFVPEREPESGLGRVLNYDQKVFVGPSWFRIYVQELRLAHEQGPISAKIDGFRTNFYDWRHHKAGI